MDNALIKKIQDADIDFNDDDGYPTDELLEFISALEIPFSKKDVIDLLDLVKDMWSYPERANQKVVSHWGEPYRKYTFSTGGWSGNESLIDAVLEIDFFKSLYLKKWEAGGYYEFMIATDEPLPPPSEVDIGSLAKFLGLSEKELEQGVSLDNLKKVVLKLSESKNYFLKDGV